MKHAKLITLAALFFAGNLVAQTMLTVPPEPQEKQVAKLLREGPGSIADSVLNQMEDLYRQLWQAENPQAILDELGTDGPVLLEDNRDFGLLLAGMLQEKGDTARIARLQKIQAMFLPHEIVDGKIVLIIPEPEPTPEETPEPTPEPTPTPEP